MAVARVHGRGDMEEEERVVARPYGGGEEVESHMEPGIWELGRDLEEEALGQY